MKVLYSALLVVWSCTTQVLLAQGPGGPGGGPIPIPVCANNVATDCAEGGEFPVQCGDKPCYFIITGYQVDPQDSSIEIPQLEYRCKTIGHAPTQAAHNIYTSEFENCTQTDDLTGYTNGTAGTKITCWVIKTCSLSCTPLAEQLPPEEWPKNRYVEGASGTNAGTTIAYQARCNDGVGGGEPVEIIPLICSGERLICVPD